MRKMKKPRGNKKRRIGSKISGKSLEKISSLE